MSEKRVVVVEDEVKIARLIEDYLTNAGYAVELLLDGTDAIDRVLASPTALVVIDRMLPGRDGLEICRELRRTSSVPVILLTARVDERDRLDGFEAGADDYLCKPFSPPELVARVRSILRRAAREGERDDGDVLVHRNVRLELDTHRCTVDEIALELTPVEFRLLREMLSRPGKVFSRYQLMRTIYDDHRVVSDRTIDSHVRNLRRKLPDVTGENELIRSRYGVGYAIE